MWEVSRVLCCLLITTAAALDPDFDFDDNDTLSPHVSSRRYVYDPHNGLCASLECGPHEACVIRDADTALCLHSQYLAQNGGVIRTASSDVDHSDSLGSLDDDRLDEESEKDRDSERDSEDDESEGDRDSAKEKDDDDVFYESGTTRPREWASVKDRCVSCGRGSSGAGGFVCGSDNRTYSSLCRLDWHNCARRARDPRIPVTPVRAACAGFCPCNNTDKHRNNEERRRRLRVDERRSKKRQKQSQDWPAGCSASRMAERLLAWCAATMDQQRATHAPNIGFPRSCPGPARWMFTHLDTDGDGVLDYDNLYALRHDSRERCLRPFLTRCMESSAASPGGVGTVARKGTMSRAQWCGCLKRGRRPCAALQARNTEIPGAYTPSCDARGYFLPRQCAGATCWCVEPRGARRPGSHGVHCPGEKLSENDVLEQGAPDDDEDAPASGDGEIRSY